jgi:hypothetical protein
MTGQFDGSRDASQSYTINLGLGIIERENRLGDSLHDKHHGDFCGTVLLNHADRDYHFVAYTGKLKNLRTSQTASYKI